MSGRYEIKEKIGEGGLGAVHVAFDRELSRDVAVKRLRKYEGDSPDAVQVQADDLIREAQALSSFQHPNIVTIYDIGKDDDGAFVVMELLKGKTLDELVGKSRLSLEDFLEVARQTLDGMIAAHERGMVHRDLKPGNIMVERLPSGRLQSKILDFGLAKFSRTAVRQTEDQEAGIFGSVHFMAPEQFERAPLDARADLYALGCIYYQTLSGAYPFKGNTGAEVMSSHLQHRVDPLFKARPDVPKWLCDWIMWLINRKPEHRPPDARSALDRFNSLSGRAAGSTQPAKAKLPAAPAGLPPGVVPVAPAPPGAVPVPPPRTQPLAPAPTASIPQAAPTAPLQPAPSQPPSPQPRHPSQPQPHPHSPVLAPPPVRQSPAQIPPPPPAPVTPPAPPGPHAPAPASRRLAPLQRKSPAGLFFIVMLSAIMIGIAIWGFFIYSDKQEESRAAATYNRLVKEEKPKGDAYAVTVLAKMMQRGGKVAKNAVAILEKLEGTGVEPMIVQQIGETSADARVNFINVAVRRKLPKMIPALITAAASAPEPSVREAALTGLIELAGPDELDNVLGLVKRIDRSKDTERRLLTEAVYASASRDTGSRGSVRLISALNEVSGGEDRGIIIKVLGRLGGDEALSILQEELTTGDAEAQRAAVFGLTSWPNGKAATVLSDFSQKTSDENLRELAMKGFVEVIGRSGDLPGEKKVEHLMKAIKSVQSSSTKRSLFLELAKIPDETALNFLADLYDNAEDRQTQGYAEQAERQLAELMPRVIEVEDLEVLMDAEKATRTATRGLFFNRIENTIQNWDEPSAWVLWHVRIKKTGTYLVEVIQAHEGDTNNSYEVHFGGSVLPCKVAKTASRETFENTEAGTVEINEPGLYELIIKPKVIEDKSLMTLRGVALVREE